MSWEPTNRAAKLKMAADWLSAFNSQPSDQTVINKERWRVTEAMETELTNVVQKIQGLEQQPSQFLTADSKKELAGCYDELTKHMRDIKRMCFMTPPLTDRDYGVLGLHVPDTTPTPVHPPRVMPVIEHSHKGAMTIEFAVKPDAGGHPDDKADYGLKFKGCIIPRKEPDGHVSPSGITYKLDGEPTEEYELSWDMFTRKKKFALTFHQHDFEGRFYYCARYENSKGEGGPWCPVAFASIV